MSRLHLLQGISGIGKSSLPRAFADAIGGLCKTVSVQAGSGVEAVTLCIEALLSPNYNPPANGIALDGLNRSRGTVSWHGGLG